MSLYSSFSSQPLCCAWLLFMLATACERAAPPHEQPNSAASVSVTVAALDTTRAAAVQRADDMALAAARAQGTNSAELLEQAAALRRHLYRTGHRPVDALEAIENLRALEQLRRPGQGPALTCRFQLERLLLEAELKRDPNWGYREIYSLRAKEAELACRAVEDRALAVLGAFRPLPNVLAELEHASEPRVAPSSSADSHSTVAEPAIPAAVSNEPARLTGVERYGAKDAARVVVGVTRPTRFQVGELDSNGDHPRLFVDIEDASSTLAANFEVGGLLERVRLGKRPHGVRVVLDLSQSASHRVFYLPEPFRLVIDVLREEPKASAPSGKRRVQRVVLDPGHGGHDPGAIGAGGLQEKDVVLDVAHRAAPLIARELGISTLLTRDADQFVPLDERTARANAFHADLFVSIHCNASEDVKARGVMSFVLDVGREELATRVAARENAASARAAVELANSFSQLNDKASRDASNQLAELLQRSAMASLGPGYPDIPNSGVKQAGFYVLAGARMPAVLFETSFISNLSGEAHLNTPDFRQKLADAIVNAVRAYRDGL